MSTRHTHHGYSIHPARHHTHGRRHALQRQLLGIVLIVVGSVWLYLRLTGRIGHLPSPIWWVEGILALLEGFSDGGLALAVPQAGCGMLAT